MLEDIKNDFRALISLYEREKQRSDSLQERVLQAEGRERDYKAQITVLTSEIDNLKLLGAFNGSADTAEARARLDKLIREIDKCIKLLEKQ